MKIEIRPADYADIESMRELYRQEANCQIVRYSALIRGFAKPYVIHVDGRTAGYGAVGTHYNTGELIEFYTLPHLRSFALPMFRELLTVSQATHIQAQTNMPLMLMMLYDCAQNITSESILFQDTFTTNHVCPGGLFRQIKPEDTASLFPHTDEPVGEWVIEANGTIVATGGYFTHYNPPFGDIYMEVSENERQKGYGSYLVQEIKRICYEAGKMPAARCNFDNVASRHTLQKAGFLPCGRLLVGEVTV